MSETGKRWPSDREAVTKFRHVKAVKDRAGKVRYYFRLADGKLEPMRGEFGSAEFAAHHAELLAERNGQTPATATGGIVVPLKPKLPRYRGHELDRMLATPEKTAVVVFAPGTLGWATKRWIDSREFAARPEGTRKNYKRLADLLIEHKYSRGLLVDLRSKHVTEIARDLQEERGLSRGRAMLAVISNVWEYAIDLPECKIDGEDEPINPTAISYRKVKYSVANQHKRWPEKVCTKFLDGAPDHLRLMFALLLYTGQRRSDVQKMQWSHYDPKTRILNVWQKKTKEWVPVYVLKPLAKILAETPRIEDHILISSHRQSHYAGESSLSHTIRNRLLKVGVPDGIYTCHGLRVTAAHILAERGATEQQLMKIFGWRKPDQAAYYVREANKADIIRAGMEKWEAAEDVSLVAS